MEVVIANFGGKTRREVLNGRDYIVAPLTLIVPGVLAGSKGPLYYPPEEIQRDPSVWNHVPIVVNHPCEDGEHVSAREPRILNKQGIGYVYHAVAGGNLTAEGWFDVEATRRVDQRIYNLLIGEKPIEVSTGLYTDNYPAPQGAAYNGRPYSYIARNYRPDHLAILPDQKGACSVEDGCGVMVNTFCPTGDGGGVDPSCSPGGGISGSGSGEKAPKSIPDSGGAEYRGFKLAKEEGANIGYAPDRHNKKTHTSAPRRRKFSGVSATDSEGYQRNFNTLKEAIKFIDSYHGETTENLLVNSCTECGLTGGECNCNTTTNDTEAGEYEDNEDGWVTMPNGVHVFVKDGKITKGPKELKKLSKSGGGKAKGKGDDDESARKEGFKSADDKRRFEAAGKQTDERDAKREAKRQADRPEAREASKRLGKLMSKVEKRIKSRGYQPHKTPTATPYAEPASKSFGGLSGLFSRIKKLFTGNELSDEEVYGVLVNELARDDDGQFSGDEDHEGEETQPMRKTSVPARTSEKDKKGKDKPKQLTQKDAVLRGAAEAARRIAEYQSNANPEGCNQYKECGAGGAGGGGDWTDSPKSAAKGLGKSKDAITKSAMKLTRKAGASARDQREAADAHRQAAEHHRGKGDFDTARAHETLAEGHDKGVERFIGNAAPNQPRSKVTGTYKKPNSGTGKGDAHEAGQRGAMVLTDKDRELGKAAYDELTTTGSNPPSWVTDESKWDRAKAAADKGSYEGEAHWAVVAHVYQKMGGQVANTFCPTGEGGGQDNTCSPGKGSGETKPGVYKKGAKGDELKSELLRYIEDQGEVHTQEYATSGSKSFRDMQSDLGHKKLDSRNPLKNPVNDAVVKLIDSGHLEATDVGRGTSIKPTGKKLTSNFQTSVSNANPEGCNQYKECGGGEGKDAPTGAEVRYQQQMAIQMSQQASSYTKKSLKEKSPKKAARFAEAAKDAQSKSEKAMTWLKDRGLTGNNGKPMDNSQRNKPMNRNATIKWLVANCDCFKVDEDLETLNHLTDDGLAQMVKNTQRLRAQDAVVNAIKDEYGDVYLAGTGQELTVNAMPAFIKEKAAVEAEPEEDEEETEMVVKTKNKSNVKTKNKSKAQNAADEMTEEEGKIYGGAIADDIPPREARAMAAKAVGDYKANKRITDKEWLESAPPGIQSAVRNAMEIERQERSKLVKRLTANVANEGAKARLSKRLLAKPLDELRDMTAMLPPVNNRQQIRYEEPSYDYSGAAGGATGLTDNEQMDVLDLASARQSYDPLLLNSRNGNGKRTAVAADDE